MLELGAHIVVRGMVQGVGFRYFVSRHATHLGVKGFVRNLPNGDVEVEVHGTRSSVEELISQLRVGPRSAHVTNLMIEWIPVDLRYNHFNIE